MSSRRVLVVALLGAAAYCSLEPEPQAQPVARRPLPAPAESGITPMPPPVTPAPVAMTPITTPAVAAAPAPSLAPRPVPEATGRIEPLHAAPQIVHETTPPTPYTVVAQPPPSRGAWFPMPPASAPSPIPEAVAPQTVPPPAYYPPPPMFTGYPPPPDHTEALTRLLETAQQLESRVERLDARLTRTPERELPPPGPRLEAIHGAAPARRTEPDTVRGFDLAVRLIRRLMARIDRIEENLDIQEETEPEDRDLRDPSATGLWRNAPRVRR